MCGSFGFMCRSEECGVRSLALCMTFAVLSQKDGALRHGRDDLILEDNALDMDSDGRAIDDNVSE